MSKRTPDISSVALAEQANPVMESDVLEEPPSLEKGPDAQAACVCTQPPESLAEPELLQLPPCKDDVAERAASNSAASTSKRMPVTADRASSAAHTPAAAAAAQPPAADKGQAAEGLRLARMWVYPIKSCAGFEPATCWPLGPNGLALDREWALVDADGVALTLKRVPKLATVRPVLDLQAGAVWAPALLVVVCAVMWWEAALCIIA